MFSIGILGFLVWSLFIIFNLDLDFKKNGGSPLSKDRGNKFRSML